MQIAAGIMVQCAQRLHRILARLAAPIRFIRACYGMGKRRTMNAVAGETLIAFASGHAGGVVWKFSTRERQMSTRDPVNWMLSEAIDTLGAPNGCVSSLQLAIIGQFARAE